MPGSWVGDPSDLPYVLVHQVARTQVAATLRAVLALPAIRVVDAELLHRATEVDEDNRLGVARVLERC